MIRGNKSISTSTKDDVKIGDFIIYRRNGNNLRINMCDNAFWLINRDGVTFSLMENEDDTWDFKMHGCKVTPIVYLAIAPCGKLKTWILKKFFGAF